MPNYTQPDFRIPAPNPAVTVQPHQPGAASGNPLGLIWPLPGFVEKLNARDDPQGTIKAGKSGKGGPG